jgi:bifunctional non-homologous end joining protein LigD
MIVSHADLHFVQGGSDKVYHCAIEDAPGGFNVIFAYGRRGSTLATGTKTNGAVTMEVAEKVYNKLIAEKSGKGYVSNPGVSGNIFGAGNATTPAAFVAPVKQSSGHLPQLLNVIEEKDLEFYLSSPLWGAQEKMDGERRAIHAVDDHVSGINRKGQLVILPSELWNIQGRDVMLDGEIIGCNFYAFDLVRLNGDLRDQRYIDRYLALKKHLATPQPLHVNLVELAITTNGKRTLYERIKSAGGEGIVFKLLSAPYESGRPNSGGNQVKFKFWENATCIAGTMRDKRSVPIYAWDVGNSKAIAVGNVTIPPNHAIPGAQQLVEVKYLYYYEGGSLYQPIYMGVRTDVDRADCSITKLKRKV